MATIIITQSDKQLLFNHLLHNSEQENMAVTYCGYCKTKDIFQLFVKDLFLLKEQNLVQHTKTSLEINESTYKEILLKAKQKSTSLIFWHSHPFAQKAWFSSIDNANDLEHAQFIKKHLPKIYYGNVVVTNEDYKARFFNKKTNNFQEIKIETITQPRNKSINFDSSYSEELDRNYKAFGKKGQSIISQQKVAIVGGGGLGWQIAQQLTALGVRRLLLIDPDIIEKTNLNRLPSAPFSSIGKPKVRVLAGILKKMNPSVKVNYRVKSILEKSILRELKEYDIIIGAVDSENIRLILNNFAVQYFKFYIDAGSEIILENNKIKHAGGQVTTVIPGVTPCLMCNHLLDWKIISYENLKADEKKEEVERGYIRGVSEPSASVVSINGVVASALVNEFIALTTRVSKPNHYLFFDLMNTEKMMFSIQFKKNENCIVCHKDKHFGSGDTEKPVRQSQSIPQFLEKEA